MSNTPRLPDPKPGEPVKAEHVRQIVAAIKKCWVTVGIGGGLEALYGENGVSLSAIGRGGDVWAYLAPGQSVTAASGTTKGTGTVTLFDTDGVTPRTGPGSTVDVLNAGGAVAGGVNGYLVKLGVMADGSYSLDVAPCAAAVS